MKRLEETEELLEKCKGHLTELQLMIDTFKAAEDDFNKLSIYYDNDYLDDISNPDTEDLNYGILDEDSIWNTITAGHELKIDLLKEITKTL